ncbi:MAG: hypothetical protein KAJ63_04255, partial [Methyloprofundus sp.]|nr:hypothetical protein [Methyloprofundus sp.]
MMMLTKYNKWLNKLVDLAAGTLLCLLVFSFFNTGHAKNNECPTKPVILTDQFSILDDSSRSLTIEQVSSPDFFQEFNKNKQGRINLGLSNSAHWVRIDSSLFFDCEQEWFLLFSWGQQDYINFYWQENNSWHQVVTGAKHSYSSRQIKDRKFWFHIPDLSKNHSPYFIRLEGKQTMLLMSLWNQDILSLYSSSFQLAFGIYLGILVGFIFYNLCVFFSLRDTSYLYYVIYLISIALVVADSQGLTMQYLWSDKPEWSARFSSSCLLLSTISYLSFVSKFLNSLSFSPKSHRLIRFYIKILLTFLCVSFFYTSTVVAIIIPALVTIGFSLSIITIAISIKSNYRPAIFVGLANIIILGGMFWAATILGGIFPIEIHSDYEGMWWTVHLIFPVSILLEAILLSLALASRIKLLKQENLLV